MILYSFLLAAILPGVPPVEVVNCTTGIEVSDMLSKTNGNYEINFVNRDKKTVDAVTFGVHLGSSSIFIRDVGQFTTGIQVSHRFSNRGGEVVLAANPHLGCEVLWVHFTDGTEWRPTLKYGGPVSRHSASNSTGAAWNLFDAARRRKSLMQN